MKTKVYGLTGGSGCGKSTIAGFFRSLGVRVICADTIAHKLTEKEQLGYKKIKDIFGELVFDSDGSLNRNTLFEIVFSDEKKRKLLENILHPLIMKNIHSQIQTFSKEGEKVILVEAALIFEAGYDKQFDGIIVISCLPRQQIERLCQGRGIDERKALLMIQAQTTSEEKMKKADFVIDNSGNLEKTLQNVKALLKKIT